MKFKALTLIAVLVIMIFGSTTMTAFAAQGALPGDHLYGVKVAVENMRLSLATGQAEQAQLNLGYAEARLNEMISLASLGRYSEILPVAGRFEQHIQEAKATLAALDLENSPNAVAVAAELGQFQAQNKDMVNALLLAVNSGAGDGRGQVTDILQNISVSLSQDDNIADDNGDGSTEHDAFLGQTEEGTEHDATIGHADDGMEHDANDDQGDDGTEHDAFLGQMDDGSEHSADDDQGDDGTEQDASDDQGDDGSEHAASDDQGDDDSEHDATDDKTGNTGGSGNGDDSSSGNSGSVGDSSGSGSDDGSDDQEDGQGNDDHGDDEHSDDEHSDDGGSSHNDDNDDGSDSGGD